MLTRGCPLFLPLQCVALKPDWAKGYSRLGAAYHGLGEYEEAATAYDAGKKTARSDVMEPCQEPWESLAPRHSVHMLHGGPMAQWPRAKKRSRSPYAFIADTRGVTKREAAVQSAAFEHFPVCQSTHIHMFTQCVIVHMQQQLHMQQLQSSQLGCWAWTHGCASASLAHTH